MGAEVSTDGLTGGLQEGEWKDELQLSRRTVQFRKSFDTKFPVAVRADLIGPGLRQNPSSRLVGDTFWGVFYQFPELWNSLRPQI